MVTKKTNKPAAKTAKPKKSIIQKYKKMGMIGSAVIIVAALGALGISGLKDKTVSVGSAIEEVTADAANGASLNIAVVRMDAVLGEAKALKSLRSQKEKFETKLRDELTSEQKSLEKEKAEIEKSQSVLSGEALQRRVEDYQRRVSSLQRNLSKKSQSIDNSYQKSLAAIQEKHLSPLIEGIIAKKNLSLVIDGRFARMGKNIENLDITDAVIKAMDKKISSVNMETPQGF